MKTILPTVRATQALFFLHRVLLSPSSSSSIQAIILHFPFCFFFLLLLSLTPTMARLTLRPHNHFFSSPIYAHKQPFLSVYTIFPHHHQNPLIKSRVKCSASGTERVRESKKLPPKDPIEDPKPQLPIPEVLSTETGFEQNWPPWKNIPQRYKLIGATSLAFVICNMDKVSRFKIETFFFAILMVWF